MSDMDGLRQIDPKCPDGGVVGSIVTFVRFGKFCRVTLI